MMEIILGILIGFIIGFICAVKGAQVNIKDKLRTSFRENIAIEIDGYAVKATRNTQK